MGAISLEYGFNLDRPSNESIGEVHFSIGNIFLGPLQIMPLVQG